MLKELIVGIVLGFCGCLYYLAAKKKKAEKGRKGEEIKGNLIIIIPETI
jgi:hypothetical protein